MCADFFFDWLHSTKFGRDGFDAFGKLLMEPKVHRAMFDFCAHRIYAEIIVVLPVPGWADWAGTKATAAIGTNVVQDGFGAGSAERAFKGTDPRFS